MTTLIKEETLEFLNALEQNNDKVWLLENNFWYTDAKLNFKEFCTQILMFLIKEEEWQPTRVEDCLFRMNRDVRFSKNKKPYKEWFSVAFANGGKKSGGMDYYLHIQPNGKSFLGGGMYQPTPEFLKKFRTKILENAQHLKSIINTKGFKSLFSKIFGKQLKTCPKGYDKNHPEIELLRYNEIFFMCPFSDEDVLSEDFQDKVLKAIEVLSPYCKYLNAINH
jgi:uncharacterized protein (TIGR02453 family)